MDLLNWGPSCKIPPHRNLTITSRYCRSYDRPAISQNILRRTRDFSWVAYTIYVQNRKIVGDSVWAYYSLRYS